MILSRYYYLVSFQFKKKIFIFFIFSSSFLADLLNVIYKLNKIMFLNTITKGMQCLFIFCFYPKLLFCFFPILNANPNHCFFHRLETKETFDALKSVDYVELFSTSAVLVPFGSLIWVQGSFHRRNLFRCGVGTCTNNKKFIGVSRKSRLQLNTNKTEILVLHSNRERTYEVRYLGQNIRIKTMKDMKICGIWYCNTKEKEYKYNIKIKQQKWKAC